jgi:hypothetical protein
MNPSMMHTLQRHRDILYDHSKEFKRVKSNVQAARDHAELLGTVRDDIKYIYLSLSVFKCQVSKLRPFCCGLFFI